MSEMSAVMHGILKEKKEKEQQDDDNTDNQIIYRSGSSISIFLNSAIRLRGEELMDPWEMFCELTRQVVENQNVFLDVYISREGVTMQLMPYGEFEEGDDE